MSLDGIPVIALIPARGGSKGVLRKNLKVIAGRPLVSYTLDAAIGAAQVDEVYLSSDDEEILAIGRAIGVHPIKRPAESSTDTATAMDVVSHFIGELIQGVKDQNPYIVYLQPTSPLRDSAHIDQALTSMADAQADKLLSVVELHKSPFKSFLVGQDGRLQSLFEEKLSNARRQDLPCTYAPNGAIYIFRINDYLLRGCTFPSNGSLPFVMTEEESLDIDTEDDVLRLEKYLEGHHG